MGKTYTGIDVGSRTIKMAVCDGDSVKMIVREPVPEGMLAEGYPVSFDALADFIKDMVKQNSGIAKEVALLIPPAESLVRRINVPAMSEKELQLNLPYEFRDYIAQGKDRYVYDYAVLKTQLNDEGQPESLDLLAVAAQKEIVAGYAEMFRRAGLKLRTVLPVQAACQNLMGSGFSALANCCFVDFAHTGTKLHFFADGIFDVTRIIEIGGVDIDRAIASACDVDEYIANGYKLANYENVQSGEAAKQVYESIAVEMARAINFYSFNNPESNIEVAYCCGGGSLLLPLMESVEANVSIELRSAAEILPPMAASEDIRALCPGAIAATLKVG